MAAIKTAGDWPIAPEKDGQNCDKGVIKWHKPIKQENQKRK